MSEEAQHLNGGPGQQPLPIAPYWAVALILWAMLLWILPDPRPLAAPEWPVQRAQSWVGMSEPTARALVTFALRAAGVAVLGMLVGLALSRLPMGRAALFTLIGAPFLAVVVKWMNFGYFPIASQLAFIVAAAVAGALAGLVNGRQFGNRCASMNAVTSASISG